MKYYSLGDKAYNSGGNGSFMTFAYVEVLQKINQYYVVRVLKDFGCVWGEENVNKEPVGSKMNALPDDMFETYELAKENLYQDMKFEDESDHIKFYFEGNQ